MQIERQHIERFRRAVGELKGLADKEPDDVTVSAAYAEIGRIIRALGDLAPNHPGVGQHRSALAVPIGYAR